MMMMMMSQSTIRMTCSRCMFRGGGYIRTYTSNIIKESDHLRIMQWNVLAQSFSSSFERMGIDVSLQHRMPHIVNVLHAASPDIITLQEVDMKIPLVKEVLNGQLCDYDLKIKERPNRSLDGCVTMWNKKLFEVIDEIDVNLNTLQQWIPTGNRLRSNRPTLTKRDNVGFLLLLRRLRRSSDNRSNMTPKTHPKEFVVVANCHLYFNPEFPWVKGAQSIMMQAEIELFLRKHKAPYVPVIFAGDFNIQPEQREYKLLCSHNNITNTNTKNCMSKVAEFYPEIFNCNNLSRTEFAKRLCRSHSLETAKPDESLSQFEKCSQFSRTFRSAAFDAMGKEPTLTNLNPESGFQGCLDYIFYSSPPIESDDKSNNGGVVGVPSILQPCATYFDVKQDNVKGILSSSFPSDHVPIVAEFPWRN